jgi:hypothetical protein
VYVRGVPLKTHFEQASLFVEGQIPGSGVFPESALDVFDAEDASRLKYLYGLRHELTDVIDAVEGRLGVAVPYLNGAAADSIDGSLDYLDRSLDRTDRVYGVVMCVILVVFVIAMWLVV